MLSSYYSSANLRAPRFRATKHEFISVVFLSCKRELCTSFTKPSLTLAPCYQACFMVCLVASNHTRATGSLATQHRQFVPVSFGGLPLACPIFFRLKFRQVRGYMTIMRRKITIDDFTDFFDRLFYEGPLRLCLTFVNL